MPAFPRDRPPAETDDIPEPASPARPAPPAFHLTTAPSPRSRTDPARWKGNHRALDRAQTHRFPYPGEQLREARLPAPLTRSGKASPRTKESTSTFPPPENADRALEGCSPQPDGHNQRKKPQTRDATGFGTRGRANLGTIGRSVPPAARRVNRNKTVACRFPFWSFVPNKTGTVTTPPLRPYLHSLTIGREDSRTRRRSRRYHPAGPVPPVPDAICLSTSYPPPGVRNARNR